MNKSIENIKNNYTNKKNNIYITKNILLLELYIKDYNLFTKFLKK